MGGAGRGAARPTSTSSRPARWAACWTRTRCPSCAAARSPAPRTTSSPRTPVADALHARGILWTPDFVANAGGIINIAVELEPEGYDPGRARERVLRRRRHGPHRARGGRARRRHAARRGDGARARAARVAGPLRSGPRRGACPGARAASTSRAARSPGGIASQAPASSSSSVARAGRPRGEDPPLALEPVGDVLVELGRRVLDHRAVARVEAGEPEAAEAPQAVEVGRRASRRPAR